MLEVLQYIFGSFWRFLGVVVMLAIICDGNLIRINIRKNKD